MKFLQILLLSVVFEGLQSFNVQDVPYEVYIESCRGTILTKNAILTAASCFDAKKEYITIDFAIIDRSVSTSEWQTISLPNIPKYVIRHENYVHVRHLENVTLLNDIALIKLPTDMMFTKSISPATLPYKRLKDDNLKDLTLNITNWQPANVHSSHLQIVSYSECKKYIPHLFATPSLLCAINNNSHEHVHFLAGSALINANNSNFIVGFVAGPNNNLQSLGHGQALVFISLPYYFDWIEEKLSTIIFH